MFYSSSGSEKATSVAAFISSRYGIKCIDAPEAVDPSMILALGGDGFMLDTLHSTIETQIPVYGINCGNVGFLLNKFHPNHLLEDIESAGTHILPILNAELFDGKGSRMVNAINDCYFLRSHTKAAKLGITVDGEILTESFVGDGLIISTPTGSTAYNSAIGGAVLSLSSNCIILTGINAFTPKGFKSLVLPRDSIIEIKIHHHDRRPVIAAADAQVFLGVERARISIDKKKTVSVLFAASESLHKKIMMAQFR
ncbi:NAD kinase [Neorickettsia sennetsu]|uniref:ATP-NAD kinase n=1 Tax=Ehrlichia sennetsu (strain ATCC VR-367 / Miyayama) TaxID=222891 RepID=Q2GE96_EHRS3|nr:NAD kinase [Neorickettsia sennetsu]ABD45706.1 putative ATP-NAD kinase [Neorickettsia sennetsu str. Miyayama]